MYEFSLSKEVDDMAEDELRTTVTEFMEKHEENLLAFGYEQEANQRLTEIVAERDEVLEGIQAQFMEDAAAHTNLDEDVLADRFSAAEITEFGLQALQADLEDEVEEIAEDVEEEGTKFAEKRRKSPENPEQPSRAEEWAQESIDRLFG